MSLPSRAGCRSSSVKRSSPGSACPARRGSTSRASRTGSTRSPISSNESSRCPGRGSFGRSGALLRADLKDRDRLDLDQELGLRQCRDRDQGARRHLLVLAEELFADRSVIGAVADVGQIGVDLDDIGHRAAPCLDLGLYCLQSGTRLGLEIAGVGNTAVIVIGYLAREI